MQSRRARRTLYQTGHGPPLGQTQRRDALTDGATTDD